MQIGMHESNQHHKWVRRLLHRMSLTPGCEPDLAAPLRDEQPDSGSAAGQPEGDGTAAAVSSAGSIVDSLESIARKDEPSVSAWVSISPMLDFQEFLQRQQRHTEASPRCNSRMEGLRRLCIKAQMLRMQAHQSSIERIRQEEAARNTASAGMSPGSKALISRWRRAKVLGSCSSLRPCMATKAGTKPTMKRLLPCGHRGRGGCPI